MMDFKKENGISEHFAWCRKASWWALKWSTIAAATCVPTQSKIILFLHFEIKTNWGSFSFLLFYIYISCIFRFYFCVIYLLLNFFFLSIQKERTTFLYLSTRYPFFVSILFFLCSISLSDLLLISIGNYWKLELLSAVAFSFTFYRNTQSKMRE